jgi:hypothetical protein
MKIVGAEGLDAQAIRHEVGRGARFVLYTYCISIVVMTYKRPSNIYFIKPGQNRIIKGLPFVLLSLVLGWWGFPWGPVYTLQSVVNDLLGGKDVTDDILTSLAPAPQPSVPAAEPPAVPPTFGAPKSPEPSSGKKIAVGVAVVALLAGAIICAICYYRSTQLAVVLVSGAPQPYTVELNGTRHQLASGHPVILTVPEGTFVLTGGPRGAASPPQTFHFALPFFARLSESRVAVINPDRTAIIYEESTTYYAKGTQPHPNENPTYTLYANEASYFLPKPDYVFAEFPRQLQMPQDATRTTRTRLAQLAESTPQQRATLLQTERDYATMRRHLELLAGQRPADENLLSVAVTMLNAEDGRSFFQGHLADRPVLVEWHRYYQGHMERHFPAFDLVSQYRGWLAAEPDSGVWCYLLGRVCADPAETRALNERALTAPQPCDYAYNGLGVDALSRAEFARALDYFNAAERKGLKSASLRYNRRLARLAVGEYSGLLAEARSRRKVSSDDVDATEQEITYGLLAGLGTEAAEKVRADCLAEIDHKRQLSAKEREDVSAYLSAVIAYGTRDVAAFAREMSKLDSPTFAFQAAVSGWDHAAAATALKKISEPASTAHFLCFLAAELKHDDAAAEAYFGRALEVLDKEDQSARRLGVLLRHAQGPTPEEANALMLSPDQKRIVMAALGWRYPDRRAAFLDWAKRMNFDPAFPHLLIEQATATPAPPPS